MRALGDRSAADVTPRDVNALLNTMAATGVSARTVNRARSLVAAIYNYASDEATHALAHNPAARAQRRRENDPSPMEYYRPEDVEAVARALAAGVHRDRTRSAITDDERAWRRLEDEQDADIVRVAAYAGLRRGELLALRWSDVDFTGGKITVSRAISAGHEAQSAKSRKAREVPLTTQAAAAIDRVSRREGFTGRNDYVFANRIGRRLDGSALRHRYVRARDSTGLRPLPFHSLRHAFGSQLVAAGIDLASVQAAMGHGSITTTQRYLHARPAVELADRFSQAFSLATPHDAVPAGTDAGAPGSGRGA